MLCVHLGLDTAEFVGEEMIRQGRLLVDAENDRLRADVQRRIRDAQDFLAGLTPEEVDARRMRDIPAFLPDVVWVPAADSANVRRGVEWVWADSPALDDIHPYDLIPTRPGAGSTVEISLESVLAQPAPSLMGKPACPACDHRAGLYGQFVRASLPRLEGERLVREAVFVATHLLCLVCVLRLASTAEVRSAGLTQESVVKQWRARNDTEDAVEFWYALRRDAPS